MNSETVKILEGINTSDIVNFLQENRKKAFIIWGVDDVKTQAFDQGFEFPEDLCIKIISNINRAADCNHGITWDTINYCVDEAINDSLYDVKINVDGDNINTKFSSLMTNENIEEWKQDNELYYYGLTVEQYKNLIGKGETLHPFIAIS